MASLPTHPPVAPEATLYAFQPSDVTSFSYTNDGQDFVDADLTDWKVKVASSLANAVPAEVEHTTITIHKHQIVIERKDSLYRLVSIIENVFVVASSVLLVGVSASVVAFALSTISTL